MIEFIIAFVVLLTFGTIIIVAKHQKVKNFRKSLKVNDACKFYVDGLKYAGWVVGINNDIDIITIRPFLEPTKLYTRKIKEIFPK